MFEAKYESLYIKEDVLKSIESFWNDFVLEENNLVKALKEKNLNYMNVFDRKLKQVFSLTKKGIRYTFEKKEDTIYFTIYYGRDSYIMTISDELFAAQPKKLQNKWYFMNSK